MNFSQNSGFVDAITKCSDNIVRFVNGLNLGYDPLKEVKTFPVNFKFLTQLGCRQLDGEGEFFRILDFYNEKIGATQHGSWRSYEEQEKLFAIGRQIGYKKVYGADYVSDTTVPAPLRSKWTYEKDIKKVGYVVTNARGGRSFHNYGLAVDIVLRHYGESVPKNKAIKVNGKLYDTLRKVYEDSGIIAWAKACKLEWGGYWTDFPDPAHFQDTAYDIIPYKLYGQYNLQNEKNCSFQAVRDFARGLWNETLDKFNKGLEKIEDAAGKVGDIFGRGSEVLTEVVDKVTDVVPPYSWVKDVIKAGYYLSDDKKSGWLSRLVKSIPFFGLAVGGIFLYFFFGKKSRRR